MEAPIINNHFMDAIVVQGSVGDNKHAVEKNGSEIRDHMEVNLEASEETRDYEVSNDKSKKNIHEADLTVQPLDKNPKMDAVSTEHNSGGEANRKKKKRLKRKDKKATIKDEVHSIDQTKMEEGSIEDLAEGNATEKRKRRQKSKKAKVKDEVRILDQNNMDAASTKNIAEDENQSVGQTKMDTGSTENHAEGILTAKKPKIEDESQTMSQTKMDTCSSENLAEGNETIKSTKIQDEVRSMDQAKMVTGPTENFAEGNVIGTRKKNRKRIGKAKTIDEVQSKINSRSTENLAERNVTMEGPQVKDEVQSIGQTRMDTGSTENLAEGNVIIKNSKIQDEAQSMDQTKMDPGPSESSAKGNMTGRRKKKRKIKKAKIKDEVQSKMDTRPRENLAEGNVIIEKVKVKDEAESIYQSKMGAGSIENIADGNVTIKNPNIQEEAPSMDPIKRDTGPTEIFVEGNVAGKMNKKRKRHKKAKSNVEVQSEIDAGSTENNAEGNVIIKKPKIKDEVQSVGQTQMDTGSTENLAEGNVTIKDQKTQDEVPIMDQAKMQSGPTENFAEVNVTGKRKKKQKRNKKAKLKNEIRSKMDAGSTENFVEGNVTIKKPEIKDEAQSMHQTEMDTVSTENLAEGDVTIKNPKVKEEVRSMDKTEMDSGPTEDFTKGNVTGKRKRKCKDLKKAKTEGEFPSMSQGGFSSNSHLCQNCGWSIPREFASEGINNCVALARSMGLDGKLFPCESQQIHHPNLPAGQKVKSENGLSEVSNEIILDEEKGYADSTCNVRATTNFPSVNVKVVEGLYPKMTSITSIRRKLLVLDINGLLADIVFRAPKECKGDFKILRRAVFKRPFCDDFLKFCFENFDVGIWSSRSKRIIGKVVSHLLGDKKDKLLFRWDMHHSTKTGFKTIDNRKKPLVCKELRKIWEKDDPNLRWKKGDYDESNTLLLDDSPYKALLNPMHTAIFPHPYSYLDKNDNSLGPGGDLRVYLEGLLMSENVQKYVEQHPFGQRAISEQDISWEFYSRVLHQMSNPLKNKTPSSVGTSSSDLKSSTLLA